MLKKYILWGILVAALALSGAAKGEISGDYHIAPIHLKSNVKLSLDYGATLLGSQNRDDYTTDNMIPAREGNSECLIYAGNAKNIEYKNVKLTTRTSDKRENIVLDDVEGFVNN